MQQGTRNQCILCGDEGGRYDIGPSLIRWKDGTYGQGHRCRNGIACRRRVEAAGEEWPLYSRVRAMLDDDGLF